jgi:8-oxo-dGTP pyrophosphatase MutT (NUDIX family)
MPARASIDRARRMLLMWSIRHFPLPWRIKWLLIWLPAPKVTLSACAVVEDAQGRVLVLRSRYSGDWQLPGGGVERRETVEQAVRRECREELSRRLTEARLLGIVPVLHGLTHIALYQARLDPGPILISDEHTEFCYLARAALPAHLRRLLAAANKPPSLPGNGAGG